MAKIKNPLQLLRDQLPRPLRNRYALTLVVFFMWMTFADTHNFFVQWRLQQTVNKLQEDIAVHKAKVREAELARYDMEINREKFAREKYFMKKANEDVFIVIPEDELPRD